MSRGAANTKVRRVVITGVGAVTPLGADANALYEGWRDGRTAIEDGLARCADFDPSDVLSPKEARRSDRFAQLAVAASEEALAHAGWNGEPPHDPDRVGCVIGTGIGGLGTIETQHDVLRDRGAGRVSPLSVPLLMANAATAALAMRHGLRGPAQTTVSACAAGTDALGTALRMIRAGDCDAVVAGGAESALTPLALAAFAAMGAVSKSGVSRPFDARRDGFVMGEGAGVLVLEELEAAEARGATVLAELTGYGASADAHHVTAPEPDGRGAARAIERALDDAGIGPAVLDYVNAHGTSTPLNDRAETEALKTALGPVAYEVPISSTKSAIGHLLGGAGAVEAVATVLALRARTAPPTLGYGEPDEGLDLDYVTDGPRSIGNGRPPLAMSSSFGFGGHNAVICLAGW
ncbi:MAG: beta-ketoacyl-ACP synthase II [Thermoleophilaceae bacterium]|nr:beta-ketoacyl-ACP synthase II [Thermoleophilaceae bacterium]MBA3839287.1 beta-ketoacyl-ACP synthase II [Thermoleophilaceae bacterium]